MEEGWLDGLMDECSMDGLMDGCIDGRKDE